MEENKNPKQINQNNNLTEQQPIKTNEFKLPEERIVKNLSIVISEFYSYSQVLLFFFLIPIIWWQSQIDSGSLAYFGFALFAGLLIWVIYPLVCLINVLVLIYLSRNKSSVMPKIFILGGTLIIFISYLYIFTIS